MNLSIIRNKMFAVLNKGTDEESRRTSGVAYSLFDEDNCDSFIRGIKFEKLDYAVSFKKYLEGKELDESDLTVVRAVLREIDENNEKYQKFIHDFETETSGGIPSDKHFEQGESAFGSFPYDIMFDFIFICDLY